ncbi:carbohydrate kinase family protein [Nesterenkonia natronophila]|uniref:Carbohydrate kinase n=1 Tax=Nesterenkonia natronophila TaxID=2174932 RepID=A0A3A4FIX8_9MICC|nr:carbohydrate kinase [Nesterenkonia natronophila]RJN32305.1 carbohydrate kinase [Nesterenkonia natronophila]
MDQYLAVIGECLVDVVESETSAPKAHVGGSPFNVAVGLALLEHKVVFAGRRGNDDYGRMIARALRAQGIISVLEADEQPTSVATATLDPTGQASYEFSLDWSLPPADELATELTQAAGAIGHLHTGSLAAMIEPGASVVKAVLRQVRETSTISYDPNYRPTLVPNRDLARQQTEEFVTLADVVQASTDDLELLYPERSFSDTMQAWLELGPALVTVTRGASGAMALARSGFVEQPAFPIDVADTVGAGDSFMAATLSSLRERGLLGAAQRDALGNISERDVAEVLHTAAQAAAITSSRFGAQPPTAGELAAALADPSAAGHLS